MSDINFWAVVASAVASMVIGSIWYGPLFGKKYTQLVGMDKWTPEERQAKTKQMGIMYFLQFLGSLLMFYVLAKFTNDLGEMTINGGIMTALWVWVGFVVPIKIGDAIWGGKWPLFWLGIGNMLLTLLAVGAIIGAWN